MNFFWPRRLNPYPNGITRFGRVAHWIGLAVGGAMLIGMITLAFVSDYVPTLIWTSVAAVGVFLICALIGRPARYILAGE